MEIEYFMSSLASDVMGILTENFLWMRTLGSTPILESEVRNRHDANPQHFLTLQYFWTQQQDRFLFLSNDRKGIYRGFEVLSHVCP